MIIIEREVAGLAGPLRLRMPAVSQPVIPIRAAVVALHPANDPHRDQPLMEHLAQILVPLGFAVASFDRRTPTDGGATALTVQAADAMLAVRAINSHLDVPVGIWGFSQGAWAAGMAAADEPAVAFLALLGCCGVSPAVQMRYLSTELLRRNGYGAEIQDRQLALRLGFEEVLRGNEDRAAVEADLADAAAQPWFPLVYLPDRLPEELPVWTDMDFDPEPFYAKVRCPVLLCYGGDEETVPVEPSVAVWRRAAAVAGNDDVTITILPGLGHWPTIGERHEIDDISPVYAEAMVSWFGRWSP